MGYITLAFSILGQDRRLRPDYGSLKGHCQTRPDSCALQTQVPLCLRFILHSRFTPLLVGRPFQ